MKQVGLFLLLIVCGFQKQSQYQSIDYDFMNQALSGVSKCSSKYILLEKSYVIKLDSNKFNFYWLDLHRFIDSNSFNSIIHNSQKKYWGSLYFHSDSFADSLHIRLITTQDALNFPVIKNNTNCKTFYYICSLPVFDSQKQYAVIDFGGGPDRLNMYGCKYLLRKNNGKWKVIQTFDVWRI